MASLDSKETRLVLKDNTATMYSPPGYLLFLRGSTLIAQPFDAGRFSTSGDAVPLAANLGVLFAPLRGFTVSETGTLVYRSNPAADAHLIWVDRTGRLISEAAPPGDYADPELSPDGKRVVFYRPSGNFYDVFLIDLERHITSRFTFQGTSGVPIWSPDGRTVVFASVPTGAADLAQRPADMSTPEQILLKLSAPPLLVPSDWSSDGRYLAYYRTDPKTGLDLWILPMFGDRKPLPFANGAFNESQGQFSPDGKWMAYVSDESGTPQIYVQSFPQPAGKLQVSTAGGSQPRWRRDGKELFYLALDGKLMAAPVKTGTAFAAEAPRALFPTTLNTAAFRPTYSVAPDGQRFLLDALLETSSPPMTLVENWTGMLKRKQR